MRHHVVLKHHPIFWGRLHDGFRYFGSYGFIRAQILVRQCAFLLVLRQAIQWHNFVTQYQAINIWFCGAHLWLARPTFEKFWLIDRLRSNIMGKLMWSQSDEKMTKLDLLGSEWFVCAAENIKMLSNFLAYNLYILHANNIHLPSGCI